MTRNHYDDEDRDDPQPEDIEDLDREDDDEDDDDDQRCPACGQAFYRGAPKCPQCGEWLTGQMESPSTRIPTWLWTGIVALLVAFILVMWHGLGR